MKKMREMAWLSLMLASAAFAAPAPSAVHVWEKQELTFTSAGSFANPYTDVIVWVDLAGPGFISRPAYGPPRTTPITKC